LAQGGQRPLSAVPRAAKTLLIVAMCAQVAWQTLAPAPIARASALGLPPDKASLRLVSLGEPIAFAHALALYLQAFDNQPGVSIPYRELDYASVEAWLEAALTLDPGGHYPLMMAAHLYSLVPDEAKQRRMLEFVHRAFLRDPDARWRWLAHAAIVAKHRLKDMPLALRYADEIALKADSARGWARQMRIFMLEDMGEMEAATVLLGGLLASGEVSDPAEIRFLTERLEKLRSVE
jgi:hypothetical protein